MKRRFPTHLAITLLSAGAGAAGSPAPVVQSSTVKFEAVGPAGLKINGESGGIRASETSGKVTLTAPMTEFHTGIGLRDKHLRNALEADKHKDATLVVDRSAIKLPQGGESASGAASGALTLHGVTKPAKFTYTITKSGDGYKVHAEFQVNIQDYQIKKPCYLGVCVEDVVKIAADMTVSGV